MAQGLDLPGSVAPFILRSVVLAGVDSVMRPTPDRIEAWRRLGTDLDLARLDAMTQVAGLADLPRLAAEILDGKVRGRVVIDPST
jgi:acrylyl-CoA reductase (NADPH)